MAKNVFFISYDTILDMKNDTYDMREHAKSLGKLQDGLNTTCVNFGKPALKSVGLIKKTPQISNLR